MNILFLTQICPYPPTNGSAIKTYNILKHLGAKHEISLFMFIRGEHEMPAILKLSPYCREIDFCMIKRSRARNLYDAGNSILRRRSFMISRDAQNQMRSKVREALAKATPDLIYADHLQMFQYSPNPPPCPVLLDDHNVEWRIIERFSNADTPPLKRLFGWLEWRKLRTYELAACESADAVLTVTPADKDTLVQNGVPSKKITALPVGVNLTSLKPVRRQPGSREILMFGTMSWPPNIDAVRYFHDAVYPLVKREVPGVRFTVVGANPPSEIRSLGQSDSSVRITGFVEDIRPYAENTAVFVVPLRIGSGMRVKILDAMALGLPIVTTSIGCEGIDLKSGEHAIVADTPHDFARATIQLLKDHDMQARLGFAGRALVESMYSWQPILKRLDEVLSSLQP